VHVLFVHKNFPGQFEDVARFLVEEWGWGCTFVSEPSPGGIESVERLDYQPSVGAGGGSAHPYAHEFEQAVAHAAGVFEMLEQARIEPDLIVGHSGFGSTLFLPELFPGTPVVNYFEYFYPPGVSALRADYADAVHALLGRTANAMILLDLEYCSAGYTPTRFQHSRLPAAYGGKVRVIPDPIDTSFWRRRPVPYRAAGRLRVGKTRIDPETRIVTYVSRGLESLRGFDIFMATAKRVYEEHPNVVFLVVGADRVAYGDDLRHIEEPSFKEHVLVGGDYDLDRILFLGLVGPERLATILSLSDLHLYLSTPFVLSWSLLNAMACECVVLASSTEPVREVIENGRNGLLRATDDVEGIAEAALDVLREPASYRPLAAEARETVIRQNGLAVTTPRIAQFYEEALDRLPIAGG
jgi:glycosyltransferase involved in cell wall biosynthesis